VLGVLVLGACGCRPPTEVTIVITTNVACEKVTDTGIVVGSAADVEQKHVGTVTSTCTNGRIGTIVLVPSKARDAAFVVKVVSAVGAGLSSEGCLANPTNPDDVKGERGCIVARRELGFIPQTPLTLPIVMHQACIGVQCAPDQTCIEGGVCASDKVDPHLCAGPGGCEESALGTGMVSSGSSSSSSGTGGKGGMGGGPTGPSSSSGMGGMGGMMSSNSGGIGGIGGMMSSSMSITGGMGGGPTGPSSSGGGTAGAGGTGSMSSSTMMGSGGAGGTGSSSTTMMGSGGAGGTGSMSSTMMGSGGAGGTGATGSTTSLGSGGAGGTGATGGTGSTGSGGSSGKLDAGASIDGG
jgi:hypothetical protein